MSEQDQTQSVSQAVQELSARVETWERKLEGWRKVISETLLDALEQGEAKAEARAAGQVETWAQEQAQVMEPWLTTLARAGERQVSQAQALAGETHDLHVLTRWLEQLHEAWVWGLSRQQWKGLVVNVGVTLIVVTGVMWFGPAAQERARLEQENARLEQANVRWEARWAVTTEGGKAAILKRAGEQQRP